MRGRHSLNNNEKQSKETTENKASEEVQPLNESSEDEDLHLDYSKEKDDYNHLMSSIIEEHINKDTHDGAFKVIQQQTEDLVKSLNSSFCSEINKNDNENNDSFFSPQKYKSSQNAKNNYQHTDLNILNNLKDLGVIKGTTDNITNINKITNTDNLNKSEDSNLEDNCNLQYKNNANKNKEGESNKLQAIKQAIDQVHQKSNKITQNLHSNYLKGNYSKVISSHYNCRILQDMLLYTKAHIIQEIFLEIKPHIHEMLVDFYSNYFCQKLYGKLELKEYYDRNESETTPLAYKEDYLREIFNNFEYIACNKVGTFPLQKILEEMSSKAELEILNYFLINELKENKLKIICLNSYGVHVIEKLLIKFKDVSAPCLENIHNTVYKNLVSFSQNSETLCLVKKMILYRYNKNEIKNSAETNLDSNIPSLQDNSLGNEKFRNNVISINDKYEYKDYFLKFKAKIESKIFQIMSSQFGTYTMHTILEDWNPNEQKKVLNNILENCVEISKQTYGSNAIERCLELGGDEYFLNNFYNLFIIGNQAQNFEELVFNYCGSFVVQKFINLLPFKKRKIVIEKVESVLFKSNKENKIFQRWKEFLDKLKKNKSLYFKLSPIHKVKENKNKYTKEENEQFNKDVKKNQKAYSTKNKMLDNSFSSYSKTPWNKDNKLPSKKKLKNHNDHSTYNKDPLNTLNNNYISSNSGKNLNINTENHNSNVAYNPYNNNLMNNINQNNINTYQINSINEENKNNFNSSINNNQENVNSKSFQYMLLQNIMRYNPQESSFIDEYNKMNSNMNNSTINYNGPLQTNPLSQSYFMYNNANYSFAYPQNINMPIKPPQYHNSNNVLSYKNIYPGFSSNQCSNINSQNSSFCNNINNNTLNYMNTSYQNNFVMNNNNINHPINNNLYNINSNSNSNNNNLKFLDNTNSKRFYSGNLSNYSKTNLNLGNNPHYSNNNADVNNMFLNKDISINNYNKSTFAVNKNVNNNNGVQKLNCLDAYGTVRNNNIRDINNNNTNIVVNQKLETREINDNKYSNNNNNKNSNIINNNVYNINSNNDIHNITNERNTNKNFTNNTLYDLNSNLVINENTNDKFDKLEKYENVNVIEDKDNIENVNSISMSPIKKNNLNRSNWLDISTCSHKMNESERSSPSHTKVEIRPLGVRLNSDIGSSKFLKFIQEKEKDNKMQGNETMSMSNSSISPNRSKKLTMQDQSNDCEINMSTATKGKVSFRLPIKTLTGKAYDNDKDEKEKRMKKLSSQNLTDFVNQNNSNIITKNHYSSHTGNLSSSKNNLSSNFKLNLFPKPEDENRDNYMNLFGTNHENSLNQGINSSSIKNKKNIEIGNMNNTNLLANYGTNNTSRNMTFNNMSNSKANTIMAFKLNSESTTKEENLELKKDNIFHNTHPAKSQLFNLGAITKQSNTGNIPNLNRIKNNNINKNESLSTIKHDNNSILNTGNLSKYIFDNNNQFAENNFIKEDVSQELSNETKEDAYEAYENEIKEFKLNNDFENKITDNYVKEIQINKENKSNVLSNSKLILKK